MIIWILSSLFEDAPFTCSRSFRYKVQTTQAMTLKEMQDGQEKVANECKTLMIVAEPLLTVTHFNKTSA